jgi:hypothetical protein
MNFERKIYSCYETEMFVNLMSVRYSTGGNMFEYLLVDYVRRVQVTKPHFLRCTLHRVSLDAFLYVPIDSPHAPFATRCIPQDTRPPKPTQRCRYAACFFAAAKQPASTQTTQVKQTQVSLDHVCTKTARCHVQPKKSSTPTRTPLPRSPNLSLSVCFHLSTW